MDLVWARAQASNMLIPSFGYGRSHDPASPRLVSNNTGGTYTFVREWANLRACIAGCVGGMGMSLLEMKLYWQVVDGSQITFRKVPGVPSPILSSDGRHVNIDLDLCKLELDNTDLLVRQRLVKAHWADSVFGVIGKVSVAAPTILARRLQSGQTHHRCDLTLAIGDSTNLTNGIIDRIINEVLVFEVNGVFFDPAATKSV
jgi:hypothetical protein